MNGYLSPKDIQEVFRVSKSTALRTLKRFEESGGEVIRIGRLARVSKDEFIEFLRGNKDETT